ncbi:MAG: polysaccharide biosynthesis/export family protein [Bacteroidia bacterium]|nr:polysaccharide biosynthesis/export family protein [Bacteroidia bacterium]
MKHNRSIITILFFLIVINLLFSCASKKNFVYFQDHGDLNLKNSTNLKLKENDVISINIFGCDEESLKIFNLPISQNSTVNRGYYIGSPVSSGYTINSNGEVDFPVVGLIKVEGLTIEDAASLVKLRVSKYLKDPKVNIQLLNFKVTVLGDVKSPGTIQVPNDKITLIEALGISGDLNISAIRKNVIVLRDEKSIKKEYIVDLTNKQFLNSPVYYLQQNDIVYVEANKAKINSSNVTGTSSIIVAIASLVITTINILTK